MALYSLNHKVISKAQLDWEGKAAARVLYITRTEAATEVLSARVPEPLDRSNIVRFCAERESSLAKNGRIAECFIIALPNEATHEQRIELVTELAEHLSKAEVPWLAGLHDGEGDSHNAHAHLMLFDQPQAKKPGVRGRRANVMALSRDGALEAVRADWESIHNSMMLSWGYGADSMIDSRSLEAQGASRMPTLHEGAAVHAMAQRGQNPVSATKQTTGGREVDWPAIDEGRSRPATNALVTALNDEMKKDRRFGQADRDIFADFRKERGDCCSCPEDGGGGRTPAGPGSRSSSKVVGRSETDRASAGRTPDGGKSDRRAARRFGREDDEPASPVAMGMKKPNDIEIGWLQFFQPTRRWCYRPQRLRRLIGAFGLFDMFVSLSKVLPRKKSTEIHIASHQRAPSCSQYTVDRQVAGHTRPPDGESLRE